MRPRKFCVWGAIDQEGQVVRVGYGPVENPLDAVRALPEAHADLLAGLDSGRLKMRILLGGGCGLSGRMAVRVARLLAGRPDNPRRRGRPVTVVRPDGTAERFPSIARAARALRVSRGALAWHLGGHDAAGRLIIATSNREPNRA